MYQKGDCSKCGRNRLIANKSKKLCVFCNKLASIERTKERKKKLIEQGKAIDYDKLNDFYLDFWNSFEEKKCFETGENLYQFNKWHIHHILEKRDYPQHALNEDVCVLLSLEQHSLWHSLSEERKKALMPKTYKRYLELIEKYNET